MSCFIIKGKAIYVRSEIDGREYCKTNGNFESHLRNHNLTVEDYVERFIDSASICPHCNAQQMKLERSTWKWIGSCGAKCRSAAIKAGKAKSFSNPERRQLFIDKLKASQTREGLQKAKAAAMLQMTPEALEIAKTKRRQTCEAKYGDPTYSNREQITATKALTTPEQQLLINQRRNATNAQLYGNVHVLKFATSKFERNLIELFEAQGCIGQSYKSPTGQFYIGASTGYFLYDFVNHQTMRIIELNGDYWHANPNRYKPDDIIGKGVAKMTAKEKWSHDAVKLQAAIERGYEIKVVWESEANADPDKIIKECIEWLQRQ